MFNSSEPSRQGYKDGFARYPEYRGYYGDKEWSKYLSGYEAGLAARQAKEKAPYPFCLTPEKCAGKGYCPRDIACNE